MKLIIYFKVFKPYCSWNILSLDCFILVQLWEFLYVPAQSSYTVVVTALLIHLWQFHKEDKNKSWSKFSRKELETHYRIPHSVVKVLFFSFPLVLLFFCSADVLWPSLKFQWRQNFLFVTHETLVTCHLTSQQREQKWCNSAASSVVRATSL